MIDKKLFNILREIVDPKAFINSHSSDKVLAVWWYKISTGELELSTDPKAEHTISFKLNKENKGKHLLAGRVYNHKGDINLIIYVGTRISDVLVIKIKDAIEFEIGVDIDYVLDTAGRLLLENRGERV